MLVLLWKHLKVQHSPIQPSLEDHWYAYDYNIICYALSNMERERERERERGDQRSHDFYHLEHLVSLLHTHTHTHTSILTQPRPIRGVAGLKKK